MGSSRKTIVIGATFPGCGRAATEADCLVLEPGCQVGSDFVFSFDPGTDWDVRPVHPWASEFQDRLLAHGVLRDGRFQVGRLAPAFAGWCLDHGLRVLLLSRVLDCDEHHLTALTPGGVETFTAETIIDSRVAPTTARRLTALVTHPSEACVAGPCGPFWLSPGPSATESFLRLDLAPDITWPAARTILHRAWLERPPALREWRLALIGARFAQTRFANPVLALDAGLRGDAP